MKRIVIAGAGLPGLADANELSTQTRSAGVPRGGRIRVHGWRELVKLIGE